MNPIDGDRFFAFLTEQKVKETGAFSKGLNKGLNIAKSALKNKEITLPWEVDRVKHGRWEPRKDVPGFVNCSVCHDCNIYDDWADGKKWKYCPNCGAKMDLEGGGG